jgi:DNA-directed RNA polymerase I, II, and III subunit RPABC1
MEQSRIICLEMLKQRNYDIIDYEDDKIVALKPDGHQMIVFFSDSQKFNVKNIQVYISLMNELEIFHSIIVYKEGVTSFTKKAIEQSMEMKFELFAEEDLQYNITKHRFQPIFERLTEEEANEFKKKYGLNFAIMRKEDPIAKFYNYQRGDIIKITRKNGYVTYRIVKG